VLSTLLLAINVLLVVNGAQHPDMQSTSDSALSNPDRPQVWKTGKDSSGNSAQQPIKTMR
jgi:hypothetical protein